MMRFSHSSVHSVNMQFKRWPVYNKPLMLAFEESGLSSIISANLDNSVKKSIQLWIAVLLTASGILLLFFGETSTFVGALFGVDYKYKSKQ